jgi:hypothetical protein
LTKSAGALPAVDHVDDAAGRARHDVLPVVELLDVVAEAGAADAGVALHVHEVAERQHHLLDLDGEFARRREDERLGVAQLRVDHLEHGDREGGRFAGTCFCLIIYFEYEFFQY